MAISIGELEAILKLKDELSGQLQEASKNTSVFGSMFEGTMGKAMAVGAGVSAVIAAMEVALVSLGNRGSDINDVAGALDSFTGSAEASNDILTQMKAGTLGTVDSFTLMKESSRLLGAGVDLNAEQFGELSKAAFALQNRGLGPTKDMLALVSDAMVTGRTRAIAMKLGVVDVGDAEIAYANKLGKTKDALTDSEKTESKRIAVMSLLEKAVKQAGEAHRDFGEELEAASAFVSDFVDEIASAIAKSPVLSSAVERIGIALSETFNDSRESAVASIVSALETLATTTTDVIVAIVEAVAEIVKFTKWCGDNAEALKSLSIFVGIAVLAINASSISLGVMAAASYVAATAMGVFNLSLAPITLTVLAIAAAFAGVIIAYKYFSKSSGDATAAAADHTKELAKSSAEAELAKTKTSELAETKRKEKEETEKQSAAALAQQEVLKASKKQMEEQAAALVTLAGYTKGYEETLKTVDAAQRVEIENYIKAGAGLGVLAKAYPKLTQAQIESIDKNLKAVEKLKEETINGQEQILKAQEGAAAAERALAGNTLATRLATLEAGRRAALTAASKSIADVKEFEEAALAINKEYALKAILEQRNTAEEKNKIIRQGFMLYASMAKENDDAVFNLTATDLQRSLKAIEDNETKKLEVVRALTDEGTGLRALSEAAVRKGSADSRTALMVDNEALRANSTKNLQEIANKARTTYEAMKAHPENFSKATIEAFKKTADAAQDTASGIQHNWKDAFTNIGAGVTNILIDSFTKGGGIVGAAKGVAVLAGAEIGKAIGKMTESLGKLAGPIGAAVGALAGPLVEALVKMFDHTTKDLKRIASSYGVTVSDEIAAAIKASMKSMNLSQVAATVFNATKLFPTVNTSNINEALRLTHDAFSMIETRQLSVAQAGKVVDEMFAKMSAAGTSATGLISKGLMEIIKLNETFGTHSASIAAFVTTNTKSAVEGLTKFVTAGGAAAISSQQSATALGSAITASFVELIKQGMSVTEAITVIGPAVKGLQAQLTKTGFDGSAAFKGLTEMVRLAGDAVAGPALDAVNGLNQAMKGLHNAGILNQEMFIGLAGQIATTFTTLVDGGADGRTAMQLMQPSLQTIWELQKDFGYAVDEGTQLLLDQAETAGVVGARHQDIQRQILDVLERIATVLGSDLPAASREAERQATLSAQRIQDELNQIEVGRINIEAVAAVHWNYDTFQTPDITVDPFATAMHGGLVTDSGVQYLATGGTVRGYAQGTDTVPAMLTPGEAVLTTRAVGTLGTSAISRLNNGGSMSNDDVISELRLLRKQQAASDRQLPLLVALSVRDAMQLNR